MSHVDAEIKDWKTEPGGCAINNCPDCRQFISDLIVAYEDLKERIESEGV